MKVLEVNCLSCNSINKIPYKELELYKEFNCSLCSLIILIVDEELLATK